MKNNFFKTIMYAYPLLGLLTFFSCYSRSDYSKNMNKNYKKDTTLKVFDIHNLGEVQTMVNQKDLVRDFFIPSCNISNGKLKLSIFCKGKICIKLTFEKKDDYYVFERTTANSEEQRFSYYFLAKSKIVTYSYCCKPTTTGYFDTTHVFITIQQPNKDSHFKVEYNKHTKNKLLNPNPYEAWNDNKSTIRLWASEESYIKDSIVYVSKSNREFYKRKIRNYDIFFDNFLGSMCSCECQNTEQGENIKRDEYYQHKPK